MSTATVPPAVSPRWHHLEQIANTASHSIGLGLSIAGAAVLVTLAALRGGGWPLVGCAVFATALVLLYLASSLYHGFQHTRVAGRLRVLDHCAIYLMIAGTYTPFLLARMRGGWGWSLLGAVWVLALAGVIFKLFFTGRFERLSTLAYLAMGWIIVIGIVPLWHSLPLMGWTWLLMGGLAYSAGTFFYRRDHRPLHHAVWHLFVLAGSALHYFAVLLHVVPPAR